MTKERNCFVDGKKMSVTATAENTLIKVTNGQETKHYQPPQGADLDWAIDKFIRWIQFGDKEPLTICYDLRGAREAGIEFHPQAQLGALGVRTGRYHYNDISDSAMVEVNEVPSPCPGYISVSESYVFA